MNVVCHQAVGQHFDLMQISVFLQPSQVNLTVIIKKHRLTPIATLGNVVRITCKNCSKKGSVPFFSRCPMRHSLVFVIKAKKSN
jgi:hypothetical protein